MRKELVADWNGLRFRLIDTGGLDIKQAAWMRIMKKDMGGAANVLALAGRPGRRQADAAVAARSIGLVLRQGGSSMIQMPRPCVAITKSLSRAFSTSAGVVAAIAPWNGEALVSPTRAGAAADRGGGQPHPPRHQP